MLRSPRQRRAAFGGLVLAGLSVLLVVVLDVTGWLRPLEHFFLDLRFRYANSIESHPDIVIVAIDDRSLETVGRWPWSRGDQALMIDAVATGGARAIGVDLIWSERERAGDALVPALGDAAAVSEADQALIHAVARAGNVHLACYLFPSRVLDDVGEAVAERLSIRPDLTVAQLSEALGLERAQIVRQLAAAREEGVARYLRTLRSDDFAAGATERTVAATPTMNEVRQRFYVALGTSPQDAGHVERALQRVLRRAIGTGLMIRSGAVATGDAGERGALATNAQGINALDLESVLSSGELIEPPLPELLRSARGAGFTNLVEMEPGAIARRMRLVEPLRVDAGSVRNGLPSLALSIASALHDQNDDESVGEPHGASTLLIPWVRGRDPVAQFAHVPASYVWSAGAGLRRTRTEVEDSARALRSAIEAHVAAGLPLELAGRDALGPEIRAALIALRDGSSDAAHVDDAAFLLRQIAALDAATADAEARRVAFRDELREHFDGKIVLVGYTATALADMVATPTHPRAPGVIAHANVLNALLSEVRIAQTPRIVTWGLVASFAVMATLLMLVRGSLRGSVALLLVVAAWLLVAAGAFWVMNLWLPVAAPLLSLMLSASAVGILAYATIEREQRTLATALAQYTSPHIAQRMAEDPAQVRTAVVREVSVLFTDFEGFTELSEQVGAARTQQILNASLGSLTEVLQAHDAIVAKFLGDGIFAFWNPSIRPHADHAARACRAAVALQRRLAELRNAEVHVDEALRGLRMRVGVATGEAVVGPCGSATKFDYTCIGDVVNVAARLEQACKSLGAEVLVSQATLDAALAREDANTLPSSESVGRLQLAGRSERCAAARLIVGD